MAMTMMALRTMTAVSAELGVPGEEGCTFVGESDGRYTMRLVYILGEVVKGKLVLVDCGDELALIENDAGV